MKKLNEKQIDAMIAAHESGATAVQIAHRHGLTPADVRSVTSLLDQMSRLEPARHARLDGLRQVLIDTDEEPIVRSRMNWLAPLAGFVSLAMVLAVVLLAPNKKDPTTGFSQAELTPNGTADHVFNTVSAGSLAEKAAVKNEMSNIQLVKSDNTAVNKLGESYGENNF